jgi:hypothetical protein
VILADGSVMHEVCHFMLLEEKAEEETLGGGD